MPKLSTYPDFDEATMPDPRLYGSHSDDGNFNASRSALRTLVSGKAGTVGSTGGEGISLRGGTAFEGSGGGGGSTTFEGGSADNGVGGSGNFSGGSSINGDGGSAYFTGGDADNPASGQGGSANLRGGVGNSTDGIGGAAVVKSGTGFNSGDVEIGAGDPEGGTRGNVVLQNLPTIDPVFAGALWIDAGVLKISAG